jgi:hypothetical protein
VRWAYLSALKLPRRAEFSGAVTDLTNAWGLFKIGPRPFFCPQLVGASINLLVKLVKRHDDAIIKELDR